jgi:hypothetical protein
MDALLPRPLSSRTASASALWLARLVGRLFLDKPLRVVAKPSQYAFYRQIGCDPFGHRTWPFS